MRLTAVFTAICLQFVLAGDIAAQFMVTNVTVDGKDLEMFASQKTGNSLQIPPWPGEIDFNVYPMGSNLTQPKMLHYKMEGYDKDWRILYSHMRLVIRMLDASNNIIAATDCRVDGESAGWRENVLDSAFIPHHDQVVAPMRAAKVQLWCVSGGPEYTTGIFAVKNVSVRVSGPDNRLSTRRDYSCDDGLDLDQPLGSPNDWKRDGSRPEMAQIVHLHAPQPSHALVLRDFDPDTYAAWIVPPAQCVSVRPRDLITVDWEEAHNVGCGLGLLIYEHMPPGNYWLRLSAIGIDNLPQGPETSLPLVVLSPFWVKPWFLLICGSTAMIFAGWGVKRHQKKSWQRRLDRLEQQGALERERTRIARDFHDDLGSRLSHIKMLSESACRRSNNPPETVTDLNRIAVTAREFTRSMEEIVWAVDPKNDSLDELATFISGFAQDLLHSMNVRCRLDMPLQLPEWRLSAEIRHNIFMAFKEALNNALKHGQPTEVRIKMTCEASRFVVTVEDNGRGFTQPRTSGHGLNNMSSRLQKCSGEFILESEPGRGTCVRFIVPVDKTVQVK